MDRLDGVAPILANTIGNLVAQGVAGGGESKLSRSAQKAADLYNQGGVTSEQVGAAAGLAKQAFGDQAIPDKALSEIAALRAAKVPDTEILLALQAAYLGDESSIAGVNGDFAQTVGAASAESVGGGRVATLRGEHVRAPYADEVSAISDTLGVDISNVTFHKGGAGSAIAIIALAPDSSNRVHPAITLGEDIYFNPSYYGSEANFTSNYKLFTTLAHESWHVKQYRDFGFARVTSSISIDSGKDWNGAFSAKGLSAYSYYARIDGYYDAGGSFRHPGTGYPSSPGKYALSLRSFGSETYEAQAEIMGGYAGYVKFGRSPVYSAQFYVKSGSPFSSGSYVNRDFHVLPAQLKNFAVQAGVPVR